MCGLQSCITIRCLPRPHEFRSCLDLLDEATLAISGTLEKDAEAQYRGELAKKRKNPCTMRKERLIFGKADYWPPSSHGSRGLKGLSPRE